MRYKPYRIKVIHNGLLWLF